MKKTSYTRTILRGSAIKFVNLILASFFAYLIRIVLARKLTAQDYGLFFAVLTFILFLRIFRDLGLGEALVKYVAQFAVKKQYDAIKTAITGTFFIQLLIASVFLVVLIFVARPLSLFYFKDERAFSLIIIFAVYLPLSVLFLTPKRAFRGLKRPFLHSIIDAMENIFVFCFIVLFFYLFEVSVVFSASAYVASSILLSIIAIPLFAYVFPFFSYSIKNFFMISKKILVFGIPATTTALGVNIIAYSDTLILTYLVSLKEVGIYNVVIPTALILLLFSNALGSMFYPVVSELWAKKDKKKLVEGTTLLLRYMLILILPFAFGLFAFSREFIAFLFGNDYIAGATAMQILIIGVVFFGLALLNKLILTGIGRPARVTRIVGIAAVLNVILNFILIPVFGINGAASATAFSYIFIFVLTIKDVSKLILWKASWFDWLKCLFAGIIFLILLYIGNLFPIQNLLVKICVSLLFALVFYIILVFKLKLAKIDELKKYLSLAI